MEHLECVIQCESGAIMEIIDPAYYLPALQVNDGTKKWYKCKKCNNIFCLDKMSRKWQFAADTYTNLLDRGIIKDRLRS